jgi:hypothetical protein
MDGLLLLTGHLIGDYIVQNDWMAANKTNGHPGPMPDEPHKWDAIAANNADKAAAWFAYGKAVKAWRAGHLACTVHCICYTLAVWACSFWWMPWWGLVACFALHWPIDRFRLAGRWMRNVSGQKAIAGRSRTPWSIIVVDNVAHIATLAVIGKLATL